MNLRKFVVALRSLFVLPVLVVGIFGACTKEHGGENPLAWLGVPAIGEFQQVSSFDTTGGNRDRLEIAPGDSAVILDVEGPAIVQRIWVTVFSWDPHYLRHISIDMFWDGEDQPSVSVPLGDFFGNGFDKRHYSSSVMGVSSGGFFTYLPMPFRKNARIVVRNESEFPVEAFYFQIGLMNVDRLSPNLQTFHAAWRRNSRTEEFSPHVVLEAEGVGTFVGLSLNAESYLNNLEFLEGDERYFVDGKFRGQGTGTADYFNAGWYFEHGEFSAPYHGVVVKDDDLGRVAAYRWHLLDPVGFKRSFVFDLEHGHANEEMADYATTAYWYQTEPHVSFSPLPPPEERRVLGVKIPRGAVMANDFDVVDSGANVAVVRVVPPRSDRYDVVVFPKTIVGATDVRVGTSGSLARTISLDGAEVGSVMEPVALGVRAVDSSVAVRIENNTADALAAIYLRPVFEWANGWSVVGPFPSPRILGTEHSPAIDSVFEPELDPSLDKSYVLGDGITVSWQRAAIAADGQVRLNGMFSPNNAVAAYAQAFLYSPDEREVTLLFGADDAHVLWVNGERVSERQGRHISRADDLIVQVRLNRGWNRILLKVADLDGGWAFQLRVADATGELRWGPAPAPGG